MNRYEWEGWGGRNDREEKMSQKYITVETEGKKKNTKKSSGQIWDQKKSLSYVKWASFYNNT